MNSRHKLIFHINKLWINKQSSFSLVGKLKQIDELLIQLKSVLIKWITECGHLYKFHIYVADSHLYVYDIFCLLISFCHLMAFNSFQLIFPHSNSIKCFKWILITQIDINWINCRDIFDENFFCVIFVLFYSILGKVLFICEGVKKQFECIKSKFIQPQSSTLQLKFSLPISFPEPFHYI